MEQTLRDGHEYFVSIWGGPDAQVGAGWLLHWKRRQGW
jgi:hypothetical protein